MNDVKISFPCLGGLLTVLKVDFLFKDKLSLFSYNPVARLKGLLIAASA